MKRKFLSASAAAVTVILACLYAWYSLGVFFVSPFLAVKPAAGDVTGDGSLEILAAAGERLYVCEYGPAGIYGFKKIIHSIDITGHKPKKLLIGDINGDGLNEISICAYKTAIFDPAEAKRPFFYLLDNGELKPVWLGSRLSRPFEDYILMDADNDGICEIVSSEYTYDGQMVLALYKWAFFGFDKISESKAFDSIKNLACDGNTILASVTSEGKLSHIRLIYDGKTISALT